MHTSIITWITQEIENTYSHRDHKRFCEPSQYDPLETKCFLFQRFSRCYYNLQLSIDQSFPKTTKRPIFLFCPCSSPISENRFELKVNYPLINSTWSSYSLAPLNTLEPCHFLAVAALDTCLHALLLSPQLPACWFNDWWSHSSIMSSPLQNNLLQAKSAGKLQIHSLMDPIRSMAHPQ